MVATRTEPHLATIAPHVDQRVRMHGMSWQAYEALLAWRGESSAVRMTFLEGELELMTPSIDHEGLKTRLARIVEAWAEEAGVPLEGAGSWTIKDESVERGAEPDECYIVGSLRGARVPDFAVEVVWTHGGIDKLEVYRKLGVREVWIWEGRELAFQVLRGERYVRAPRSDVLAAFDPELAVRCMAAESQTAAVKALREAMRAARDRKRRKRSGQGRRGGA
jgi:Uma2 family endonuclease